MMSGSRQAKMAQVLREAGWIEGAVAGTAVSYCLNNENIIWFRERVGEIF